MIPIRVWLKDGTLMYRYVKDLEHKTLCKAFNITEFAIFDLPSTARGIGSSSHGYNGNYGNSKRIIDGYILLNNEPIGRLWIANANDTFRDLDVTDIHDMMNSQQIIRG